jgi:hypothetical protein
MTVAVPGRYTLLITAKVYASSRRDAYNQIERVLEKRRDGLEYIDAEDIKIEPYCIHVEAGITYEDERDLAILESPLCATCQTGDRLIVGQVYDVGPLENVLLGWNGRKAKGYHIGEYFDGDGRYLGADAEGIEPLFSNKGATD